jgi:hypothetical protein
VKYEIGSELWTVYMAGVHARMLGQSTNPYDQNTTEQEAWQDGWQRADDGICREED